MEIASFGGETVSNSYYTEGTGKIKAKIANLNPILADLGRKGCIAGGKRVE